MRISNGQSCISWPDGPCSRRRCWGCRQEVEYGRGGGCQNGAWLNQYRRMGGLSWRYVMLCWPFVNKCYWFIVRGNWIGRFAPLPSLQGSWKLEIGLKLGTQKRNEWVLDCDFCHSIWFITSENIRSVGWKFSQKLNKIKIKMKNRTQKIAFKNKFQK